LEVVNGGSFSCTFSLVSPVAVETETSAATTRLWFGMQPCLRGVEMQLAEWGVTPIGVRGDAVASLLSREFWFALVISAILLSLLLGNKFQLHHWPQVKTLLWLAGVL
jgi:hypothetical protein